MTAENWDMFLEQITEQTELYESLIQSMEGRIGDIKELLTNGKYLKEGVTDFPENMEVVKMFDEAIKRLEAAKVGLGLANKLKNDEQRKAHQSRIMSNLNKLRNLVFDMQMKLAKTLDDAAEKAKAEKAEEDKEVA